MPFTIHGSCASTWKILYEGEREREHERVGENVRDRERVGWCRGELNQE